MNMSYKSDIYNPHVQNHPMYMNLSSFIWEEYRISSEEKWRTKKDLIVMDSVERKVWREWRDNRASQEVSWGWDG